MFTLTITTDDPDEIARLLRQVTHAVEAGDPDGRLLDSERNEVGGWRLG